MLKTEKSTVKRVPQRGKYNREEIFQVLDEEYIAHVGFVDKIHNVGAPVVIPTMYGRLDDTLFLHGSAASRMLRELTNGIPISISVASVQGLVLARSGFHHSLNYRSVVIFGTGTLVEGEEKLQGLKVISDHLIKGRWEEVREPNPKELLATTVIKVRIEEASAKIRTGGPIDDEEDYAANVWAGVVPVHSYYGEPIPDEKLKPELVSQIPLSVKNLRSRK